MARPLRRGQDQQAPALASYKALEGTIAQDAVAIVTDPTGQTVSYPVLRLVTTRARATLAVLYEGDELDERWATYCRSLSRAVMGERERLGYAPPPADQTRTSYKRGGCRICRGRGSVGYVVQDTSHPFCGQTYQRVCSCIAVDVYGPQVVAPTSDLAIWARLERSGLPDRAVRERWDLDGYAALLARLGQIEGAGERELALAIAREYAADPYAFPKAFGGRGSLLFTGDWGTGKTGLVCGILRGVTAAQPDATMRFMSWAALLSALKDAYASGTGADRLLIEALKRCDYLALDDLGDAERIEGSAWERQTAEDILLTRYNRSARTFLTSNLTREQLERQIGGRLVDRLYGDWAVVLDLPGESMRKGADF